MPKFPSGRGGKRRPTGARIDHRGTGRKANGDLRAPKPVAKKKDWFTAPPTRSTRVDKKLFRPAPKRAARPAPKPAPRRKGSFGGSGVNAPLFNPKFAKPIMAKYVRRENVRKQREAIKLLTSKPAPARKPVSFADYNRMPKYVRAPKPFYKAGGRGGKMLPVDPKPLAVRRMVDPLSKGAKREFRKNERQVVKRRDAVIAKDLEVLVKNRKNPKTVNRSVQRLRDYGVLSGQSRSKLGRSLVGEKDRQRLVAERKRLADNYDSSTPFERAVTKGAKTAWKFVTADPNALPGVEQARKSGQPVKVAGFDLRQVDKALNNSRNSTAAAALVAVEQLTRISSAEGEALSSAIRAVKSGKSLPETVGAYAKGAVRGAVDNKSGYSKPLQDVGVSRGAAAGIGFVADILLDPTTYVSFGAVGAAKAAVRGAGAAAARAAVKQGLGREAVRAATKRAMRAKAVELRRGSASVRDLAGKGESAAIAAQRRELARLEAAGKGSSKKAENIRRNVAPAGKRTESRIRNVERRTDVASRRADKVAGRVAPDRTVSRVVNGKTVEVSVPGRVTVKPSRRTVTPIGPRFRQRKELRFANAEVRGRFGGMAENQAIKGSKREVVENSPVSMKGYPKVEMVDTSRLQKMAGNDVSPKIVASKRGKAITEPIIVDFDPLTGLARVSEGNHRLAAAVADGVERVPVQVMRGTVKEGRQGAVRIARANGPDVPGHMFPSEIGLAAKTARRKVGTPADELKGTVYSIGFGKRARVKLRTSGTGFKSGSGIPGAKGLRRGVSEFAPGVRRSAEVPALGAESARVAGRQLRAGDNAARQAAKDVEQLLNRAGIRLEGDDAGTWAAIYERSGVDSKEPLRVLDDGSFVYGPKNDPVVVSDEFVKRYVDVDGARPVLKGAERVAQRLARDRKGVVRSGQPVGDATKMRASAKDVAAKEGVSEKEAQDMLDAAKPEFFPSGKRKPDPFAAATYLDNAATRFYPRRQELNKKAQIRSDREALRLVKPSNRGNIESRVDPRPLDVGNAERAANPTSLEAQSKPLLSSDPNTDLATYARKMGQEKSLNNAVTILADSGTSVKFKPGETAEDFLRRYRIPFEGEAADGRKLYELSSRNGRYDLVEVETYGGALKKIVDNNVFKMVDGKKVKVEQRQGQYVVLDNRNVAAFREARTSAVLSDQSLVRLYDRVSTRVRRLAIFTPMYQAINEMGDTWIMFTVVPAYKIPYYKARALPVVRYIQGLESGKGADALVGKGRKGKVGLGSLGDVVMFENGVERTVKEVADELIAQGGARQGILARSVDASDPQMRAATRDTRSRKLYRKVADSRVGAAGGRLFPPAQIKMKIAPLDNVNPASISRLAKSREDWSRTATYLYLRDEGYTPPDAASKMLNALIDYGELSLTERRFARRLAFFYTFPARQIPYQTKALLERPGKLAAYEKLRVAAAEAQGVDLDELKDQPWYVQANVPIPVKIKGELYWVSGNLPFNMLNQTVPFGVNSNLKIIKNDALFAITSLNPILRAPAEDAFDRNFFFRSTITKDYGDNLTPAPSWAVWLANAVPGFANEARLIKKPTKYSNGQDVWLMDNKWAWRFSQLAYGPLRLVGEAGKFRNQRGDTAAQRYGRFFTGIRTDNDKKKLEEARTRLYDKKDKLDQQVSTNRNSSREGTPADVRLKARVKEITRLIDEVNVELGIDPEFGRKKKSGIWGSGESSDSSIWGKDSSTKSSIWGD